MIRTLAEQVAEAMDSLRYRALSHANSTKISWGGRNRVRTVRELLMMVNDLRR